MIRKIVEQRFDSEKWYLELSGLSSDQKPAEGIITGSLFFEVDTGKFFAFDELSGEWLYMNADATPITGATITLGSSLTYSGSEQTQSVSSVVLGTSTLTADTDYKVVKNKATDAGDYMLYVYGVGDYSGVIGKAFTVAKANGSVSASPDSLSLTPGGDAGTSTLSVTGDGEISVASSAEAVATAEVSGTTVTVYPLSAGSATVTVTLGDSANYNGSNDTISVTVVEDEGDG